MHIVTKFLKQSNLAMALVCRMEDFLGEKMSNKSIKKFFKQIHKSGFNPDYYEILEDFFDVNRKDILRFLRNDPGYIKHADTDFTNEIFLDFVGNIITNGSEELSGYSISRNMILDILCGRTPEPNYTSPAYISVGGISGVIYRKPPTQDKLYEIWKKARVTIVLFVISKIAEEFYERSKIEDFKKSMEKNMGKTWWMMGEIS